jgi:glycosyltransferase involved in cell wall biosynthesis
MDVCPDISVVVPLHNEADNVQPLAQQILKALAATIQSLELILVDDASTDDTWGRILAAQQTDARIRAIRHPANLGQSAALFSGFRASRGSVIATLDGDLQNDPADLPRMLAELDRCDMVCGVRVARADTKLRRLSSLLARWARKLVLRVDFADSGCNLRVFKRRVLETLPAFKGVHRFMPILASSAGAIVKEMPVSHHPRAAGYSKYGVWNRAGRGAFDLIMVGMFLRRQIPGGFPKPGEDHRQS